MKFNIVIVSLLLTLTAVVVVVVVVVVTGATVLPIVIAVKHQFLNLLHCCNIVVGRWW